MRDRMANLAKPEARCESEKQGRGIEGAAGKRRAEQWQEQKGREAKGEEEEFGAGKLGVGGGVGGGEGQKNVERDGSKCHPQECRKAPDPADRTAENQEPQRAGGGKGEESNRQRAAHAAF